MRIKGFVHEELDTKVAKIDVWYDRYDFKTWVITFYNEAGDTVGESEYEHRKANAVARAAQLAEQHGGVPVVVGTR